MRQLLLAVALAGENLVGGWCKGRLLVTGEAHFRQWYKLNLTFDTWQGIFELFTASYRGFE